MLRGFLSLFSRESLLDQALEDTHRMLGDVEQMVVAANKALRHSDDAELDIDIGLMDKAVNRYEAEVRRKVFTHLSVMGTENIYPALILISIIIDVERVGDYAKNIVDLASNHQPRLRGGLMEDEVCRIELAVTETLLPKGRLAFEQSDEQEAARLLHEHVWVNPACEELTRNLYQGSEEQELSARNMVALALYLRFLKRINSHWQNILTSVVNPFDRIGFRRDF